jgi:membrane-anchored mycosin MYCP
VSGLAALIREKFPNLTAHQVIGRITDTAHDPGTDVANLLGHGVVDPVAALTATLPAGPKVAAGVPAQGVSALPDAVKPDTLARDMTIRILIVAGVVIVVFAAVGLAVSSVNYRKNATSVAPFSTEQD